MLLQFPRALLAFVIVVCCIGWLNTQEVFEHSGGNLGGTEFAPLNNDETAAAQQPPHLVLIVADDLGWNDVSWHNPQVLSPHLGQLAATGVTLNRSYVQPICTPTRAALLTSRYPFTIGRQNNVLLPMTPSGLSLNVSLLPEELHKLGYETNMVGKWHLGFCKEEYTPTMRGFDNFFGYYTGAEDYYNHVTNASYSGGTRKIASGYDFRINLGVDRDVAGTYSAFSFADRVDSLLTERNPAQPLFLYLAFQSVHAPLQVPQKYSNLYSHIGDSNRRTYLGMVTAMDEAVGKVVASLKATGHYDNSVIVFTTDNGGATKWGGSNFPLRGNKTTLWEGGTRGPAFIHSPLLKSSGTVSNRIIHVTDWFPTFLHLAGGSPPPGIDGVNQWEVLNNSSLADARNYFVYDIDDTNGLRAAVRWNQYKLVVGDAGTGTQQKANNGVGCFNVSEEATAEKKQEVNAFGHEKMSNLRPAKKTRELTHNYMGNSNKESDRFVREAAQDFSRSDDVSVTKTFLSTSVTRSQQNLQLLEEARVVNTDVGLRLIKIGDFKSVLGVLNSNLQIQLYDVVADPAERNDITEAHCDIVKLLSTKLQDEFARYVTSDFPPNDAKADPIHFNSTWSPGWC